MIDKKILPKMTYTEVAGLLHRNQNDLDDLQANPQIATVARIGFYQAAADIYNEQAQLMRRMADIYDEWAAEMRERER